MGFEINFRRALAVCNPFYFFEKTGVLLGTTVRNFLDGFIAKVREYNKPKRAGYTRIPSRSLSQFFTSSDPTDSNATASKASSAWIKSHKTEIEYPDHIEKHLQDEGVAKANLRCNETTKHIIRMLDGANNVIDTTIATKRLTRKRRKKCPIAVFHKKMQKIDGMDCGETQAKERIKLINAFIKQFIFPKFKHYKAHMAEHDVRQIYEHLARVERYIGNF